MRFPLKSLLLAVFAPLFAFSQPHFETKIVRGTSNGIIEKYETIEIGIRIPTQERLSNLFLEDHSKGTNPFQQHFLRLQFICNGKTYNVPAFFIQVANADETQNKYFAFHSDWSWRVRFAVPDTGHWQCTLLTGENAAQSIPQFTPINFDCVIGNNHGFIEVAPDKRHFQYSDGTPFFVLGQNIAWSDATVLKGQSTWPNVGYYEVYHYINNLADNGGNYVRFVMGPWSTGIQWNEVGVYAQEQAFALDSMVRIAEQRGLKVHLCLDLTTGFISGDSKENQNPIRRTFQKEGMTCADLLKDSLALKAFDDFILYTYARWGTSASIATFELMGEQDRWDGYAGREKYFTDFYLHIQKLLRDEFGNNLRMISTSTNQERMYLSDNAVFGFIDIHHYDNNFNCNKRRFHIANSKTAKKINKPFLFGELGMINGPVNAADAGDYESCNDISMHNSMWATLFMGTVGTGSCWWSWSNDKFREANYKPIRYFIDSVAQTFVGLIPHEWDGNGLETFYETNTSKSFAIGWVHNESSWWGNISYNCKERNKKEMIRPKDDDKAKTVEDRAGNKFVIKGLKPNRYFAVVLFDTRIPGKIIGEVAGKTNRFGNLVLKFPSNCADCSFRIEQLIDAKF